MAHIASWHLTTGQVTALDLYDYIVGLNTKKMPNVWGCRSEFKRKN